MKKKKKMDEHGLRRVSVGPARQRLILVPRGHI